MLLSIITPVYRNKKDLHKFLERISLQKSSNFELILVVDTNNEGVLSIIDEFKSKIKGKLRIVYNLKRVGRKAAISSALKLATGDYSIISTLSNVFLDTFVTDSLSLIKSKNTDIIEFRAKIETPFKFEGKQRKNFFKSTNIKEKPEVIAYTYPTDFNKFIRTDILRKAISVQSIGVTLNTRFSVSTLYKVFAIAETYSNSNAKIVRSKKSMNSNFNPLTLINEHKHIMKLDIFQPLLQEIMYNMYFGSKVMIEAYIGSAKNPLLSKKFEAKMNNFFTGLEAFYDTNKYLLAENKEAQILRKYKNRSSKRTYKEF